MKKKTFNCEKCGHNFTFAWNLKQHLKHSRCCGTSENNFKCTNCGKNFTLSSTLKQHFGRCIAVDPHRFTCTHCARKFTFKSSLRKHLRGRCPNIDYDSIKNNNEQGTDLMEECTEFEEVHIDEIDFIKTEDGVADNIENENTQVTYEEVGEECTVFDVEEYTNIKIEQGIEFQYIYEEDHKIKEIR